jgi:hypothetical protein
MYYCSSGSFVINDKADINLVYMYLSQLYDLVIKFNTTVNTLFGKLSSSYATGLDFPLTGMPSSLTPTLEPLSWTYIQSNLVGIIVYIDPTSAINKGITSPCQVINSASTNKTNVIGNAFSSLFSASDKVPPMVTSITASSGSKKRIYKYLIISVCFLLPIVIKGIYSVINGSKSSNSYNELPTNEDTSTNITDSNPSWWRRWIPSQKTIYFVFVMISLIVSIVFMFLFIFKKQSVKSTSPYVLYKLWKGSTLSKMVPNGLENDFWLSSSPADTIVGLDPTNGTQLYVTTNTDGNHVMMNDKNQLVIKVEKDQNQFMSRKSVRMAYKEWLQSGVVVLDCSQVPVGPGVWPSFWLNGQPSSSKNAWAAAGEIDIIEGVTSRNGTSTTNQSTLHTQVNLSGVDCTLSPGVSCSFNGSGATSGACGWNHSQICPNGGCPQKFAAANSFGSAFNQNDGGVFACRVAKDKTVTIWFWPRGDTSLPTDLYDTNPKVDQWKTSSADNTIVFPSCPNHFENLALVFNIAICGDWAGLQDVFDSSTTKCACAPYSTDPKNNSLYENASWIINTLAIHTIT